MRLVLVAVVSGVLGLAACQSAPPTATEATTTIGDTTITTSGSVAVDAAYVN